MQTRTVAYHDLDTSILHNVRFVDVVRPGVYSGFYVRANIADPSLLDITTGGDPTSVLVTVEGVRIEENSDQIGALRVANADTSFSRYDLVVSEYQWVPDNSIEMIYKIIRGKSQTDLQLEPVRPEPQNIYQTPLAWVLVRARTAQSGQGRVAITQADVIHTPRASGISSPGDVSTLKPIVDVTNRLRLYVFPGIFPSTDGTRIIEFGGAYSDEINTTSMSPGDERWFLYGVSDDGDVGVAGESATSSVDPQIGSNVLPLCVAKAVNRAGTIAIEDLLDIRFPFTRRVAPQPEQDFYQDVLGTSVFQQVRIDDLSPPSFIDFDTLLPSETGLTVSLEHGDTSLAFIYTGTGQPSVDVTITTENILSGTPITAVNHIMLLVDTDAPGMTFDYSTTSPTGGFTGQDLGLSTIQEIPGGATQLFIRFKIPAVQFSGGITLKIFSYATFLELDEVTLNEKVITSLGLDTVGLSIPNLICNGDFRRWSRPDAAGNTPDLASRDKIDYSIDPEQASSGEKVFAADGWQFTKLEFEANRAAISRVLWSRDVAGSLDETTMDYALEWVGAEGTQPGAENNLEFRTLISPGYEGNYITFSFDYQSQPREAVGIRVVFYERATDGTLTIIDSTETGPVTTVGTLIIQSSTRISNRVFAVGFIIILQQTTGVSTVYVKNARAALGEYQVLPFTQPRDADMLCRQYYERGVAYASSNVADGEEAGVAVHYGSQKLNPLSEGGEARARQVPVANANRSAGILSLTFVGDENGFVARGNSKGGQTIVDIDWESATVYPVST